MAVNSSIAEEYFKNSKEPALDDFLIYSRDKMFFAYLVKTLAETKKRYCMNRANYSYSVADPEYLANFKILSKIDEYPCDFNAMICSLSTKQQEILIFCFKFGYYESTAARLMGISPQAAHGLKKRALSALRKELSANGR